MLIANICHVPHFVAKRHADATTSGSAGPFAALPQVREGQNKSEKKSTSETIAGQVHSHGMVTRNFLCLGALVAYRA
jgi:hypothetical protein